MNPLALLALCALFVLSEAIRLETLVQTLGGLQHGGVVDDTPKHHAFDVVLTVRLRIAELNNRADASLWRVHGVWEPNASVASKDVPRLIRKEAGVKYTQKWSNAVTTYNTDATPQHTVTDKQVTRIDEGLVSFPEAITGRPLPADLVAEMGERLIHNEYRNHGYYLPIPVADFYAVLQSTEMTDLKKACAKIAADMSTASGTTKSGKFNGIKVKNTLGRDFIDCVADARITVKKSINPTLSGKKADILTITFA